MATTKFTAQNVDPGATTAITWTSWTPTLVGWTSGAALQYAKYRMPDPKTLIMMVFVNGTSNSTTTSFTIPSGLTFKNTIYVPFGRAADNGSLLSGYSMAEMFATGNTVTLYKDGAGTTWTGSNTKYVYGTLTVEVE